MSKPLFDGNSAGVTRLVEAVELVTGGIVSKPLISIGALRQTLFAMDAGQSISEHRVPSTGTVHVLDGRLLFTVDGVEHNLGPGDWLIMPGGAGHSLRADQPVRFLLTLVKDA